MYVLEGDTVLIAFGTRRRIHHMDISGKRGESMISVRSDLQV